MTRPTLILAILAAATLTVAASSVHAATYTVTFQPDTSGSQATSLRQDTPNGNFANRQDLRLRAAKFGDLKSRNIVLNPALPDLTGKSVLRAWLKLTQSAGTPNIVLEGVLHPLTESYVFSTTSWLERSTLLPWLQPGGTRGPYEADRLVITTAPPGTPRSWQIGPVLQAWNLGLMPKKGLVISAPSVPVEAELAFQSSLVTAVDERPEWSIEYTDEPPAVRSAWAEVGPHQLDVATTSGRLRLWVDAEASGSTPSGNATGYNQLRLLHGGRLQVLSVDSLRLNGVGQPIGGIGLTSTDTSATVLLPRIQGPVRAEIVLRVAVVSGTAPQLLPLHMEVDDTLTPGAGPQSLWPGEADANPLTAPGTLLNLVSGSLAGIDLLGDSLTIPQYACSTLSVVGHDLLGNTLAIVPDSLALSPPSLGTLNASLDFCATTLGSGRIVAYLGPLTDTLWVDVVPGELSAVAGVELRNRAGAPASALAPGDTMLVRANVGHAGGFQMIQRIDFDLRFAGHEGDTLAPAYRARFRWRRTPASTWEMVDPAGSSWVTVPGLCAIDTMTNTNSVLPVTLGLRIGEVARASTTGQWSVRAIASGLAPSDSGSAMLSGLGADRHVSLAIGADSAAFAPGRIGEAGIPLAVPADGIVPISVRSNTEYRLDLAGEDLVGRLNAAALIALADSTVSWSLQPPGTVVAPLMPDYVPLASATPAAETESADAWPIQMWIAHPPGIEAQGYLGTLRARVRTQDYPSERDSLRRPLIANVVADPFAADSAAAEVHPRQVTAGTAAQPFTAALALFGTGTGVNDVTVELPADYGGLGLDSVRVGGVAVPFNDLSVGSGIRARLLSNPPPGSTVEVHFSADVPAAADSTGHPFVVGFDDTATVVPAQVADPGDVDPGVPGGGWIVTVDPGPAASLEISPDNVVAFVDSTVHCSAALTDAYGNAVGAAVQWSTVGGVGAIVSSTGDFIGVSPGAGMVIARAAGLADTVPVQVLLLRGFAARSVHGPGSVYQGQNQVPLEGWFRNLGAEPVRIDSVRFVFSRLSPGDASGDFVVRPVDPLPMVLPVGAEARLRVAADVSNGAALGPVMVGMRAWGVATGSGIALSDLTTDTTLTTAVEAAGVFLSGFQSGGPIRPGTGEVVALQLRVDNSYPETRALSQLLVQNITSGAGTKDDLDGELGTVRLYVDNGDGVFSAGSDSLVMATIAISGRIAFLPLAVPVAARDRRDLWVTVSVPGASRDGDVVDLAIAGATDAAFTPVSAFRNTWPVHPAGSFPLDGFVSDRVVLTPIPAGSLAPGVARQLVLTLRLPANGYQSDVLQRLAVANRGTAVAGRDLSGLEAWADDGDGVFDPALDARLGAMVFTGDRWDLSGLATPVPLAGLLVHVTASVSGTALEGTTVRLELPSTPYVGAGMASGNDGPLDAGVANPHSLTISAPERVLFTAAPGGVSTVHPGDDRIPLLHFTAANGQSVAGTLEHLLVRNATLGSGTVAQRDGAFRRLELHLDGNGDGLLGGDADDPLLGVGSFTGGELSFDGLSIVLAPDSTAGFFLAGEVSLTGAPDGEVLAVRIDGPEDIRFKEPTAVSGAWPLDGGARAVVDGMVADQITSFALPQLTIGKNATRVLALDLGLPANGYLPDILRGLRLVNRGSAGPSDLATMELWVDGGDGAFNGGGDDQLMGPMSFLGGEWTSPSLNLPVGPGGARLFVSVSPSAGASDSSTVTLEVPLNGVTVESAHDGPLDRPVTATGTLTISGLPLLARIEMPAASVVGQTFEVRMVVQNDSGESVLGIAPSSLLPAGDAALTLLSGPAPASFDLAPAQADTFRWQYTASAPGTVRLSGDAAGTGSGSGLPRRALGASSPSHHVYLSANQAWLEPVQTMPASVNRGQAGVVPLSLTLTNPGGADASDLRVRWMRIRLEDEGGNGIVPADLLSRIEVYEGTNIYLSKSSLETSGSDVDLPLTLPVSVATSQPTTLSLRLDVTAGTTVPGFRLVMTDSSAWQAEDATSGAPAVVRLETGSYPLESRLARVVDEATSLVVDEVDSTEVRVARGATGVRLARMQMMNPGIPGITSDVRLTGLGLRLADAGGASLGQPQRTLQQVRLVSGGQLLGSHWIAPGDSAGVSIGLSLPLKIAAGAPEFVDVVVDVAPDADLLQLRAEWDQALDAEAQDENSREPVPVTAARVPLVGPWLTIQAPAESLTARGEPLLPPTVMVGQRDVVALRATLAHPGGPGVAGIRVDTLRVLVRNEMRQILQPSAYLTRIEARWNGVPVAAATALPSAAGPTELQLPGVALAAGDSGALEIHVDISASSPLGFVELAVLSDGVCGKDETSGQAVELVPAEGAELPLLSGLTHTQSPSRLLSVGLASRMPVSVVPDGRVVSAGLLELTNADSLASGDIQIDHLKLQASDRGFVPVPIGRVAERVEAWRGGALWAVSAPLTPDSTRATLSGVTAIAVPPRATAPVELRFVPRDGAASVRLGVEANDIGVIQPGSGVLAISVMPRPGSTFPMWTDAAGVESTSLSGSYSNYPNPFAPSREATTFVYYLKRPARVTLRVLTPLGETVATLLDDASRGAGLQQLDRWDGRTERGAMVYNGVYVGELLVRYDDGTRERVLRKLAVAR